MESRAVDVAGARLHVGVSGDGPDVVVLSGGPGCVHYLERDGLAVPGHRSWFPEPRGVGRSGGGPHDMERAVADLEAIRESLGVDSWVVVGHSWGSDLAVRYAVDRPAAVTGVVGLAGRGPQRDRTWSEAYEAGSPTEPAVEIEVARDVWASLSESFTEWIHRPDLWSGLAACDVPVHLVAAGADVRPSWPLQQLAALLPRGRFSVVPDVPHDFWATDPTVWVATVAQALAEL
ncbi:hydrolase [Nocardioides sp. Soil774]|uniref:alpha/beta fold hydrolase n=1 Tax=Nocardioides sp. Soil774 TaxID=1736408 RepID=UPI0006F2A9BA|nr:alpha/beta hydrolase [Nocardioides sp. Soil774]KRE92902.1 hydrolase [Nocardioides sp. Soil774]